MKEMTKRKIPVVTQEDEEIDLQLEEEEIEVEPIEPSSKKSKLLATTDEEGDDELPPIVLFQEEKTLTLNIIRKEKILAFLTSVLHVDMSQSFSLWCAVEKKRGKNVKLDFFFFESYM